ncbi:MAG: hypothetical protein R3A52_15815 [Polyangiales bacterium]
MQPDLRRRALALAAASAFAAALHELSWSNLLARWVGGTAWSVGLALALFMLGQGLGALLARRASWLARPARAWRLAELAVALASVVATRALASLPPPSSLTGDPSSAAGFAIDVLCAALALAPASLAMGAALPRLVGAAAPSLGGSAVSALYRAGLVGACAGVLVGASIVAPAVGFIAADHVASLVNLALAAVGLAAVSADAVEGDDHPVAWGALRFGAAGALGLGAQAVWHRTVVPYAGLSSLVFAAVVTVYLAAQAAGFAAFARAPEASRPTLGRVGLASAAPLALMGLGMLGVAARAAPSRTDGAVSWVIGTLLATAAVVAPAALALGVAQAAVLDAISSRAGGHARAVARVTGFGTALSAAGALAAVALIPALGPRWALAALALPCAAALAAERAWGALAGGALATAALAVMAPGPRHFLGAGWDRAPVLDARVGVQDTTAVVLHDLTVEPRLRQIVSNGVAYAGDSLFAQRYMRMIGHLAAMTARQRRRALVVCVGTGTTVDALLAWPFERVDAVDIDPRVRETLRWFTHVNHQVATSPRVRWVTDDGARYLRAARGAWDVIALEPPPPRAAGGGALYSEDFYRAARDRLSPGGVLAQWLPLHDGGAWEAALVARTFVRVFPEAGLYLVERNEAVLLSRAAERAGTDHRPEELRALGYGDVDPVADAFALSSAALRSVAGDGPALTLAWPATEMVPLTGDARPLAEFARAVRQRSTAGEGSSASAFAAALPAFVRVREEGGSREDRAEASAALAPWLRARVDDPYAQYAQGFGPWLEGRVERLRAEGMDARSEERLRALLRVMRERARWRGVR